MDDVAAEQEDAEFERWYGAWDPLAPAGAATLLHGFDRPWWVVGGWAIEAFTGVPREHEDLDVSLLSRDVPALREHLRGRWCLWCNDGGTLRPLSDRWPEPFGPDNQLWLRRDAVSPWVLDLPLTPERDGRWSSKRWESHVVDLAEATWVAGDGLRYLRPEIVLHYKARLDRAKDRRDLEVTWPLLDADSRAWLRTAVGATEPADHPWQQLLTPAGVGGPDH